MRERKNYYQGPENKMQGAKERYYRDRENPAQERKYEKKTNMQTIPSEKENMKKTNILNQKESINKNMKIIINQKRKNEKKYEENPEPKKIK